MVWGIPARLKNFQLLPFTAFDVPIVMFGRQNEQARRTFETVVLDTRDGHAALADSDPYTGSQGYEVKAHRDSGQVDLVLPAQNVAWTLEFSDDPRAPSIPYGYAADVSKKSGQGVGSIIKTLIPGASPSDKIEAEGF